MARSLLETLDREGFQLPSRLWRGARQRGDRVLQPEAEPIPVGKKATKFEREYRAMKEAKLSGKER